MGYNMKRGAAPKFKELGSSPAKDMPHEPNGIPPSKAAMMNKEHAEAEHPHKKTPAKQNTDDAKQKADELLAYTKERGDLKDKIQTLQAKGLIPGTQEFNKKVQKASDLRKFSDLEKYDDDQ
jgi:hypothetical protein